MIRISEESYFKIGKHGESAYPEECCGILLGSNDGINQVIEEVVELDNEQGENRQRRFYVTPEQYMKAEKIASEKSLDLLGFYHSHPDHPAAPSEFDREHALPWFVYIIVSIMREKAKDMTAWRLNNLRYFESVELTVDSKADKQNVMG
ncbi:MAG: Mov34/MPN/PAD-1 family protein [Candidatus Kryptoniota bacterium]